MARKTTFHLPTSPQHSIINELSVTALGRRPSKQNLGERHTIYTRANNNICKYYNNSQKWIEDIIIRIQ